MSSVKGRCDRCGSTVFDHRMSSRGHVYRCAADDALRALRKERFTGCADDRGHRTYDAETRSYGWVGREPDVNECGHPLCRLGPHIDGMYTRTADGVDTHDYRRPSDRELLFRMIRRRVHRSGIRLASRGSLDTTSEIWHAYGEGDPDDKHLLNRLYANESTALSTTARRMGIGRIAFPTAVRPGSVWRLENRRTGVVAIVERRSVGRLVRR